MNYSIFDIHAKHLSENHFMVVLFIELPEETQKEIACASKNHLINLVIIPEF